MAIQCPKCGRSYDVRELESARGVRCRCGFGLDLSLVETVEDFIRYFENEEDREKARCIQKEAQGICRMILNDECPAVDIEIAKERLRSKVEELFPEKIETYRMIYEARFRRLWEQFRQGVQGHDGQDRDRP